MAVDRLKHVEALVVAADTSLGEIEKVYNASLASKGLDPQLLIKIKNFLENLRSALDYLGREIFDRNCTVPQGKHIPVYFPILRETATQADFDAYMKGRFPGLQAAAPHLYSALEGYQAFRGRHTAGCPSSRICATETSTRT